MPAPEDRDLHPPRARSGVHLLAWLGVGALAAALAWWLWARPAQDAPAPAPTAAAPVPAASAPAAAASGPMHPMLAASAPQARLPDLAEADAQVAAALAELLGRGPVQSLLQTDGFVRRVVATVDNLPRASAAARLWPVQPTPQRFLVDEAQGRIASANAARYGALLSFAEAVPLERAVGLYTRLYPLFQQAYEELGYPGRYFNDRLVAVLDHLLQAPELEQAPQVQLLEIRGAMADPRPWVRYEFSDPALQSLSAGQKIMVRMGLANERRAKTVLAELRRQLATGAAPAR